MKKGESPVDKSLNGATLNFYLQPNDIVYLPTENERTNGIDWNSIDHTRLYKFVSCSDKESHYIPMFVSALVVDRFEFEKLNKIGRAITGEMIREFCVPVKINRLGEVECD